MPSLSWGPDVSLRRGRPGLIIAEIRGIGWVKRRVAGVTYSYPGTRYGPFRGTSTLPRLPRGIDQNRERYPTLPQIINVPAGGSLDSDEDAPTRSKIAVENSNRVGYYPWTSDFDATRMISSHAFGLPIRSRSVGGRVTDARSPFPLSGLTGFLRIKSVVTGSLCRRKCDICGHATPPLGKRLSLLPGSRFR